MHSHLNVSVKVKNVPYSKDVQIHYRGQYDSVWQDEPLIWKGNFGNYDVFTLEPALDFDATPFVEFAIRFVAGGTTYWDNNSFANVAVQPWWRDYAAAMPGVRAGGSHAPVVNRRVIASRVSMPQLVAVDR